MSEESGTSELSYSLSVAVNPNFVKVFDSHTLCLPDGVSAQWQHQCLDFETNMNVPLRKQAYLGERKGKKNFKVLLEKNYENNLEFLNTQWSSTSFTL